MVSRLAIYDPASRTGLSDRIYGKDVANLRLFGSLVTHGGFDEVAFMMHKPVPAEDLARIFGAGPGSARLRVTQLLDHAAAAQAGTQFCGSPLLEDLAWFRRRTTGDAGYSLIGITHTISAPALRQEIAMASVAPTQPWDAIICTSPAGRDAMALLFDDWEANLIERVGATRPIVRPQLPVIPLGVQAKAFAALADRPDVRAARRASMGIADGDVLIFWLGRLSFYEKAFPQPMFLAIEEAARATGATVHFAMAGSFPNKEDSDAYSAAARTYAPSVRLHLVGGAQVDIDDMWAASDIFLSLSDNIQETFGLTPVEAMAAGLPVVVSDWDGYRFTVVDGEQGFRIPTLMAPPQSLTTAIEEHLAGAKSYQQYVGLVAQHTAVDVGRAAAALSALIRSPDLRRTMGAAGRRRVREMFDHSVVTPQIAALADELSAVRAAAAPSAPRPFRPGKGDPMRDFAGFATDVLTPATILSLRPGVGVDDLARSHAMKLDSFGSNWRLHRTAQETLVGLLASGGRVSVRRILAGLPPAARRPAALTLVWMIKIGLVDWHKPGD